MITFDGDRSLRRRWFAEKKLAQIQKLGVPATAIKWNGFTIRAFQQDRITGGRVVAPMGAVVLFSSEAGIQLLVADNWLGSFEHHKPLHVVYFPQNTTVEHSFIYELDEQELIEAGYQTMLQRPVLTHSPFGLDINNMVNAETVYIQDVAALPGLTPVPNQERFRLVTNNNQFVDLNENGNPDFPKSLFEMSEMFYIKDGHQLAYRRTYTIQDEGDSATYWRMVRPLDQERTAIWQSSIYFTANGNKFCCEVIDIQGNQMITYLEQMIPAGAGMPTELRDLLLYNIDPTDSYPLGSLPFKSPDGSIGLFHCVDMTNTIRWTAGSPIQAYFSDHPEDRIWEIFYSLLVDGVVHVFNRSQFTALFNQVMGRPVGDTSKVHLRQAMNQFSYAWPQNNFTAIYDSAMFNDHRGWVYTWTRNCGAVCFSTSGMSLVSLELPAAVLAETGVRPEIVFAGSFGDPAGPLYLCICNKVKDRITAIAHGSPFTEWSILPGAPEGVVLLQARPVMVTPEKIVLIGVVRVEEDQTYHFARQEWAPGGTGLWQVLGRLPVEISANCSWAVGLYGAGAYVDALANFETPPYVLPQMPVGPYDKYSVGLPCQS